MDSTKVLHAVLAALFVAFLGFQGWMAKTLVDGQAGTNDRLTKIETTIGVNKSERERQDNDLHNRLERLEVRVYRERSE